MKKLGLKTTAIFMALCLILSVDIFAYVDGEDDIVYDVTLSSGDVVEKSQYYEPYEYDPDYKRVGTVTFNATGSEPIIVKENAFASRSNPKNVNNIIFNGTGDIVLHTNAFSSAAITILNLPSNVQFADDAEEVFSWTDYLEKATIACDICPGMFYGSGLKEVEITQDNKMEEFPDSAFGLCGYLEKINFPSTLKRIGGGCFYYASFKDEINLNEGLEIIDDCAFYTATSTNCDIEIDFPSTLKTIGKEAFSICRLKCVKLNNGLTSIGAKAFYDNSFNSVTIPASVTSIGEKAFGYISESETMDDFTIYGYRGTAAETYADENGFTFIPLDGGSSVKDVAYTPSWSSVNDYSFTVDGRADKVQIIEATGATRTFTRNNGSVVIRGFDADGNEVSSLSRELDHEVWTLKTRLTPDSSLKIHAKYNNVWEDQMYYFSVSTLRSDTTLKSAELSEASGTQSSVDCKIVTGSGVNKVRIEYEDGMTTTVNSSAAVLDETNMTYTYNLSVKPRHSGENSFKVYIKTPSDGWIYATTLTYTME